MKATKSAKPLNPKLPGRYGRMTRPDMDRAAAELDRPILLREARPMTPAEREQWKRAKNR